MFSRQYCFKEQQQYSSSKFKYPKDCSGNIPTWVGLNFLFLFFSFWLGKPFYRYFRSILNYGYIKNLALTYSCLCRRKHSANARQRTAVFQLNHQELLLPPLQAHHSHRLMATNQSNRSFLTSTRSSLCRGH